MNYNKVIYNYIKDNYNKILREPGGQLKHRFLVPGAVYAKELWDWDSWLTDVAITQVAQQEGELRELFSYQKGCIKNFVEHINFATGKMNIMISDTDSFPSIEEKEKITNSAKPVVIQHAVFVAKVQEEYEWLRSVYPAFEKHITYYDTFCKHESGLYFFINDLAIGVDNDPCTFYRPSCSSASIYLNCLMYKELLAMVEVSKRLGMEKKVEIYQKKADVLKQDINKHCYDERNGFYYSVDINLVPIDLSVKIHSGCPRNWDTLIQRIDVWSGFMAMWAGIADEEQAERMVKENYLNARTFYAPYGVRTLSKCEKMYQVIKSGNPSCWLGPIWGVSNYFTFRGLLKYGYTELANELADKTLELIGKDIAECGEMHEYYDPETGVGVNNQGFQSWNLLCANIIAWKEKRNVIVEF